MHFGHELACAEKHLLKLKGSDKEKLQEHIELFRKARSISYDQVKDVSDEEMPRSKIP